MHEEAVTIAGPIGPIEGRVGEVAGARGLLVCCHPHPLHQGSMLNKVVSTVIKTAQRAGCTTLRFNFRGVGESAGEYGHTLGEREDALSAIAWLQTRYPGLPLIVAGFSFGSFIAALVAKRVQPKQVISIAPPIHHYDYTALLPLPCPWLVVVAGQDEIIPYETFVQWQQKVHLGTEAEVVVLETASHFFHGQLLDLERVLHDHLRLPAN